MLCNKKIFKTFERERLVMKRSVSNILWGVGLIVVGLLLAGNALQLFNFNIFFRGWWTLFIIIPCFIGLFEKGDKTGYIIGLGIGIMLLLSRQNWFAWYSITKLIWPFILVVVGISILVKTSSRRNRIEDDSYYGGSYYNDTPNDYNYRANQENMDSSLSNEDYNQSYTNNDSSNQNNNYNGNTRGFQYYRNILSGRTVRYNNELFVGAEMTSVLGGMDLDLRNAILDGDVRIDVTCVLGGIDLYVPRNVRVVVNCTPILGGVDDHTTAPVGDNCPTIFINATCILGGMDIK